MPPFCKPGVNPFQKRLTHGHPPKKAQWPAPPNQTGKIDHRLGAPNYLSIRRQYLQFKESRTRAQPESLADPRVLERCQTHIVTFEPRLESQSPRPANGALAIVKHPASNIFCCFCIHRNSWLKFFSRQASRASRLCHPI